MLLLLSEWCKNTRNANLSEAEYSELNACIRYSRLSTPYLTELCELLSTPSLTIKQRMELLHYRSFPEILRQTLLMCLNSKNPQTGTCLLVQHPQHLAEVLLLTLDVSEADLYQLLEASAAAKTGGQQDQREALNSLALVTEPMLACGFLWTLRLSSDTERGLWCGLYAHGVPGLQPGHPPLLLEHGVMCDFHINIMGRRASKPWRCYNSVDYPVDSCGAGAVLDTDVRDPLAALDRAWWQLYEVQGFVSIQASITKISA